MKLALQQPKPPPTNQNLHNPVLARQLQRRLQNRPPLVLRRVNLADHRRAGEVVLGATNIHEIGIPMETAWTQA